MRCKFTYGPIAVVDEEGPLTSSVLFAFLALIFLSPSVSYLRSHSLDGSFCPSLAGRMKLAFIIVVVEAVVNSFVDYVHRAVDNAAFHQPRFDGFDE